MISPSKYTFKDLIFPISFSVIVNSFVFIFIYETLKVAPTGIEITKFPSKSVIVPEVVPLIITLAPTTGVFVLFSNTCPCTFISFAGCFSELLTSSVFIIAVKSLTLTAEISSNSLEISGRAKAATAMTANGSTYRYLSRAHGLDFFFNIIVIRFLSEL